MPYAKPSDASISPKKGPSGPIKAYLVAYNLASAAGWSYVLYLLAQHLSSPAKAPETAAEQAIETAQTLVARLLAMIRKALPFLLPPPSTREQVREALPTELHGLWARASTAFTEMGDVTALVQSGAVLEVVHVLFGFVKSPLVTTAMQVASRLFLVWGVMERFPEVHSNPLYATMVLAWSITEVIRYPFYALSLLGIEFAPLAWLRYTTFYLLYPLGAISEAFLMYASLPTDPVRDGIHGYSTFDWMRLGFFGIWWPGLYVMYTYMMKQRRKVVGGVKPVKTVKTE